MKDLLSSAKRTLAKACTKKDILSSDHIKSLLLKYSSSEDGFVLRDLAMIIVCFAGFLRYDEMSNLRCSEVEFEENFVRLYISKSKTDQFRDGNEVLLSELNSPACPVRVLKKYCTFFKIDVSSSNFFFRALYNVKGKVGLRRAEKKLSYTRARETILSRLREVRSARIEPRFALVMFITRNYELSLLDPRLDIFGTRVM